MKKSRSSLVAALALLSAATVEAAPCCGGGSVLPSLITGDDSAQVSTTVSHAQVIGDAPAQGIPVFRADGDTEQTQTLKLDGAYRLADRFQAGASVPLIRRSRSVIAPNSSESTTSANGLGDVSISAAFEALPEWSYSPWKPHGFVFAQATFPTSPSTYDSEAAFQIDARSRGFLQFGFGAALLKGINNWDFILSLEAHRGLPRTFNAPDGTALALTPGFGATALLGAGFSPGAGAFRLGLNIAPAIEAPILTSGDVTTTSARQLLWNTSAQASYLLTPEWSASLVYTDQTLLGPAQNASLSRAVALTAQKRWPL